MPLRSYYQDAVPEAGCDEAGRGCLAGPVVAAAVILPGGWSHPDLNDSKQVTEPKRHALADIIRSKALAWAIGVCDHHEIDQINILQAAIRAMHKAIDALPIRPGHLLIDGNRFLPYMGIPHMCIVGGDAQYRSIAAASILAKTYRDDYMKQLHHAYPDYNWIVNKGYPTAEHRHQILQHGICPLHRKTFKLQGIPLAKFIHADGISISNNPTMH